MVRHLPHTIGDELHEGHNRVDRPAGVVRYSVCSDLHIR